MNVHVTYRLHKTPSVEKDIQHQIEKLRKRLQVFRPELVNVNLSRLERFVDREIYFREAQDLIPTDSITKEEVIDETIIATLKDGMEKPEQLTMEPWLYRLALLALDQLSQSDESNGNSMH